MDPLSRALEPEGVTTRSAHPWFSVAHFSIITTRIGTNWLTFQS